MEICLHQENITVDAINDMIVTPITRYFDDLPVDIDSIWFILFEKNIQSVIIHFYVKQSIHLNLRNS